MHRVHRVTKVHFYSFSNLGQLYMKDTITNTTEGSGGRNHHRTGIAAMGRLVLGHKTRPTTRLCVFRVQSSLEPRQEQANRLGQPYKPLPESSCVWWWWLWRPGPRVVLHY